MRIAIATQVFFKEEWGKKSKTWFGKSMLNLTLAVNFNA